MERNEVIAPQPRLSETCRLSLQEVCRLSVTLASADRAVIWSGDASDLQVLAHHGLDASSSADDAELFLRSLEREPCGSEAEPVHPRRQDARLAHGAESALSIRIHGDKRSRRAFLCVYRLAAGAPLDLDAVRGAAAVAGGLLKLEAELASATNDRIADEESGLLTRNALISFLSHTLSRQERTGEDMYIVHLRTGEGAGDLQDIAYRLHAALRGGDIIARVGDRDFAMALFDVAPDAIAPVCGRLQDAGASGNGPGMAAAIGCLRVRGGFSDVWDLLDQAAALCDEAALTKAGRAVFGRAN